MSGTLFPTFGLAVEVGVAVGKIVGVVVGAGVKVTVGVTVGTAVGTDVPVGAVVGAAMEPDGLITPKTVKWVIEKVIVFVAASTVPVTYCH